MIPEELAALVLAAGRGRRMGTPKALLPIGGVQLVTYSLDRLAAARVRRVAVVLGPDRERVRKAAPLGNALLVSNPTPEAGPFSSLVLGLTALCGERGERPGVAVLPVDVPCPGLPVFETLAAAAEVPGTRAAVPVFGGRGGHPVLLTPAGVDAVLAEPGAPAENRLDVLLRRWGSSVRRVPVRDAGVLVNLNTPEAARSFARLLGAANEAR